MGLCGNCTRPKRPGKKYCEVCAAVHLATVVRNRFRYRIDGLCITCGVAPAKTGIVRCEKCSEKANTYAKKYNERKRALKLALIKGG